MRIDLRFSSLAVVALFVFAQSRAVSAQSADAKQLAVIAPVTSCESLTSVALEPVIGSATQFTASEIETPKGKFCHITGTIAPTIGFEVDLPATKWTQRFLQAGCGGLCGMVNASIGNAGSCQPALDGQFVVAATDLGHGGGMMSPASTWTGDPQKLIDFAYRANHLTALAAKALIAKYYGQRPRYSYFSGCSDGGREALMEAERYPDDFDGISAGAPAMLFQLQNSFYHAWTTAANTRADGSMILFAEKLPILHQAVIDHCDTLDGNKDGLLSDPRACKVDRSWVQCPANASDTSKCFTAEEWSVASKLYEGPTDAEGHHYLPGGLQPGSELRWGFIPRSGSNGGGFGPPGGLLGMMTSVVFADATAADAQAARYPFTVAQYQRAIQRHSLNDATNPDLRPFASHGGKLILWHGWSDDSIAPMISIAYYRAVQKEIGAEAADRFVRLFMIPGVGHCGGGDGFSQIDTLTPLMAWVEGGHAPAEIVADKVAAVSAAMGPGPDGRGGKTQSAPYARNNQTVVSSRPIYPFPTIARYAGSGDPASASSYTASPSPATETNVLDWYGAELLRPGFQMNYTVSNGKLTTTGPSAAQ